MKDKKQSRLTRPIRTTHNPYYELIHGQTNNVRYVKPNKDKILQTLARWFYNNKDFMAIPNHPVYDIWSDAQRPFDAGICDLLEQLNNKFSDISKVNIEQLKETLQKFLPLIELHYEAILKLLPKLSISWVSLVTHPEDFFAEWLSKNHAVLLAVDHEHYSKFKSNRHQKHYPQTYLFLEAMRLPYQNICNEDTTVDFFRQAIQNIQTIEAIGRLDKELLQDLIRFKTQWEKFITSENNETIITKSNISLMKLTSEAMQPVLEIITDSPRRLRPPPRQRSLFKEIPKSANRKREREPFISDDDQIFKKPSMPIK